MPAVIGQIYNEDIAREYNTWPLALSTGWITREFKMATTAVIELSVRLSVLRLFHVGNVVQNRRSAPLLAWHEWFWCNSKEWKIYCCGLALSSEPQIWKFHAVIWQTTSKKWTKTLPACVARLFFLHKSNHWFVALSFLKLFINFNEQT